MSVFVVDYLVDVSLMVDVPYGDAVAYSSDEVGLTLLTLLDQAYEVSSSIISESEAVPKGHLLSGVKRLIVLF